MANTGKRLYVYRYPEGGEGGSGGSGGAGGAGGAGSGTEGGAGGTGGSGAAAFADAAAARGFLKEFIPDDALVGVVPDDKVVGFATHLRGKAEEFGKSFPAEWRKLVAGENAEHLKTLERFASPKALYESYSALRAKMASGELKPVTPFPEKGSDDDKAAWRLTNGIPEKPEAYDLKLPEGFVVGEEDKPVVAAFQKHAFETNMPAGAFNAAMNFYFKDRDRLATERATKDAEFRAAAEDELRAEWQGDYRSNVGRIGMLLDAAPDGVKKLVGGARLADGTPLGNHPGVLRWLADLSRQINPAGVIVPNDGTIGKSLADEIASIENVMKTDRARYNKDEKMQARLRDLYSMRDRQTGQKAA